MDPQLAAEKPGNTHPTPKRQRESQARSVGGWGRVWLACVVPTLGQPQEEGTEGHQSARA